MNIERISSTEKEQEWIQKYRAALDISSGDESRTNPVSAAVRRVAETLRVSMQTVLKKPVASLLKASLFRQRAKAELAATPTMVALRPRSVHDAIDAALRRPPSPQHLSEEKAS